HRHRDLHSGLEPENAVDFRGPGVIVRLHIPREAPRVAQSLRFGEMVMGAAKHDLGPTTLVDIGLEQVPWEDAPLVVSGWQPTRGEPAGDAIGATQTGLMVIGLAGLDGMPPQTQHLIAIIRMEAVSDRACLELLHRRAEVFEHVTIALVELTF